MRKLYVFIFSAFILSACTLNPTTSSSPTPTVSPTLQPAVSNKPLTASPSSKTKSADTLVAITTKDGQIVVKLYADSAPNTVKTFLQKVSSNFYNGLKFHRVIEGFMAQGGDPTGTGTGGGRQKSELNSVPFKRGSLGLARTAETKEYSNDSQFFICFTTEGCQHLTNEYVNFGEVVSGFDVLDKIAQGDTIIQVTATTK